MNFVELLVSLQWNKNHDSQIFKYASRNYRAVVAEVYFAKLWCFSLASCFLISVYSNSIRRLSSRSKVHQAASPPVAVLRTLRT